jgi:signal transduction histidine kinase
VQSEVPTLLGVWDPVQLDRVISNLLRNALKYSPDGGEILVTISAEPADTPRDAPNRIAFVRVHDRGIGIPDSDLPHIFDPFYRGENVAQRTPGSGIGLSTLRRIVALHGGDVSAESREGGGATFTVRLPLAHTEIELGTVERCLSASS